MIQTKNKNILNCFTCEKLVYKYSSVRQLNTKLNLFYIPLWKDWALFLKSFYVRSLPLFISKKTHQYVNFVNFEKNKIRIYSPWIMKTNKDCYFYLTGGSYLTTNESNIELNSTSNIHNYKNYFNSYIDINVEITDGNETQLFLSFGRPFAYGLPFSNEKLIIKNHLISEKEYLEMRKEGEKNESKIEFTQLMDDYINESKTN